MTARIATDRAWLARLVAAINTTTNPPTVAGGEPDGASRLGQPPVPSGDGFSSDRVNEFMKQARAL